MVPSHFTQFALLSVFLSSSWAIPTCPLQGAVFFPAPQDLCLSSTFKIALNNLTTAIDIATSSGNTTYGPLFDGQNTSFSLEIFSTHKTVPLFNKHYSAPALASYKYGTKEINSSTIYRLGSITKLFSVYTFLIAAGDIAFSTPIANYIPELLAASESYNATESPIDHVAWKDITIGDLASQTADIGRDYAGFGQLGGLLLPIPSPAALGLPPLLSTSNVVCQGGGYCSRAQFFQGFTQRHPVYAPSTAPIYSNAAFQILAYALENITSTPFPTLIQNHLFNPLNLSESSWTLPSSNTTAVIPDGSAYALPLGDETPAGGMYSTLTDLSTLGRSILSSTLLSPSLTRRWMSPRSFTSSPLSSVGAPWEIKRTILPNGHTVDLYTKDGDLPGYASLLVLIPDWNIGFSILAAGKNANSNTVLLANFITDTLFPAIEESARLEAVANFVGTYAYNSSISPVLNSSITLTSLPNSPGLLVTSWISNNTSMLTSLIAGPVVHLYPTGLTRELGGGNKEMGFRAVFENPAAVRVGGIFGNECVSWAQVDQLYWGTVASDEFVVVVDRNGKGKSVEARALGAVMEKET